MVMDLSMKDVTQISAFLLGACLSIIHSVVQPPDGLHFILAELGVTNSLRLKTAASILPPGALLAGIQGHECPLACQARWSLQNAPKTPQAKASHSPGRPTTAVSAAAALVPAIQQHYCHGRSGNCDQV